MNGRYRIIDALNTDGLLVKDSMGRAYSVGLGQAYDITSRRIRVCDYLTQKKAPNKQSQLQIKDTRENQTGLQERYNIERKFGEAKQSHGLRRCRYVGLLRCGLQALLTAIVLNLKRMVKLLTGAGLKGPVTVPV